MDGTRGLRPLDLYEPVAGEIRQAMPAGEAWRDRARGRACERGEQLTLRADVQVALAEAQRAAGDLAEADAVFARAVALYEQKGNIAAAAALQGTARA